MPTWPRNAGALSRWCTPPQLPEALQNWSPSGKGQFRSFDNSGHMWTETFPLLLANDPNVRALLEAINRSKREGVLWDIQHPALHTRNGAGGGTPLVNGADQTGSNLIIDGASNSITNWLRQGDFIQVAGIQGVLDVTADVDTDGSGNATIPINPPIFTEANSPANNAAVEIDPSNIFYKVYLVGVSMPEVDASIGHIPDGMTLTFREQP